MGIYIVNSKKTTCPYMRGDIVEARSLRNHVNRATAKLKFVFYHTRIVLKQCMNRKSKMGGGDIQKLMGQENNRQINRTEPCEIK